jgi:hypothetical protein
MKCSTSNKNRKETGPEAQLVVDARLLDIGIPAPKPGIVYTVSLMHYEVLEVICGAYPRSSIFVGHHVPNLAGSEFRIGTCHRLRLTKEFPQHASILDAFQTAVSSTMPFFCLSFQVVGYSLNGEKKPADTNEV